VNPIGATTFFVTLNRGYKKALKRRVTRSGVRLATATLLIFAFVGNYIFLFFGTSIPRVSHCGRDSPVHDRVQHDVGGAIEDPAPPPDRQEALEKEVVGFVPLGILMFAGPGASTTVVVLMAEASSPLDPWRSS